MPLGNSSGAVDPDMHSSGFLTPRRGHTHLTDAFVSGSSMEAAVVGGVLGGRAGRQEKGVQGVGRETGGAAHTPPPSPNLSSAKPSLPSDWAKKQTEARNGLNGAKGRVFISQISQSKCSFRFSPVSSVLGGNDDEPTCFQMAQVTGYHLDPTVRGILCTR